VEVWFSWSQISKRDVALLPATDCCDQSISAKLRLCSENGAVRNAIRHKIGSVISHQHNRMSRFLADSAVNRT
jgi:hypothetical protein